MCRQRLDSAFRAPVARINIHGDAERERLRKRYFNRDGGGEGCGAEDVILPRGVVLSEAKSLRFAGRAYTLLVKTGSPFASRR